MANSIYVNFQDGEGFSDSFPLVEDPTITLQNDYQSIGDLVPGLSDIIGTIGTWESAITGGIGVTSTLKNIIDFPRWTKTNPIKIATNLLFYIQDDAKANVVDRMNKFIKMSTLSFTDDGQLVVPGVALGESISKSAQKGEKKPKTVTINGKEVNSAAFGGNSKLVSLYIPGIVYLNNAYIESITPTYSRQITVKGYPIWGTLNIQFSGVVPALAENFLNVLTDIKKIQEETLQAEKTVRQKQRNA